MIELTNKGKMDMEMKKTAKPISPSASHCWHEEFGLPLRFPRFSIDKIKKCIRGIGEPDIFLRELDNDVEIVVKLRKPNGIFSQRILDQLENFGITLPRVFEAILWQKLEADKSTIWAELSVPAVESYRQSWHQFFKTAYLGQFHPSAEQWLKQIERVIAPERKIKQRGRPSVPKAEIASICRRYAELLPMCVLVHSAVESALSSIKAKTRIKRPDPSAIRQAVFEQTRKSIHGVPFVSRIFGGDAFKERSCGLKHAKLHDPKSWKPRNLAISLLTFERLQAYETLEKKLRRQRGSLVAPSV
jgi:hypothetical protein